MAVLIVLSYLRKYQRLLLIYCHLGRLRKLYIKTSLNSPILTRSFPLLLGQQPTCRPCHVCGANTTIPMGDVQKQTWWCCYETAASESDSDYCPLFALGFGTLR